jgi:hypothetical protein
VAEETKLETVCPGCHTITHSHIDKDKYHPLATVASCYSKIRCSRCGEPAPLPRIRQIGTWHVDIGNSFRTWQMMPPAIKR